MPGPCASILPAVARLIERWTRLIRSAGLRVGVGPAPLPASGPGSPFVSRVTAPCIASSAVGREGLAPEAARSSLHHERGRTSALIAGSVHRLALVALLTATVRGRGHLVLSLYKSLDAVPHPPKGDSGDSRLLGDRHPDSRLRGQNKYCHNGAWPALTTSAAPWPAARGPSSSLWPPLRHPQNVLFAGENGLRCRGPCPLGARHRREWLERDSCETPEGVASAAATTARQGATSSG